MNRLTLQILPSPESNDHQVRIWVDEQDWLGSEFLGIDPPEFFAQFKVRSSSPSRILVGRCTCGVVGCGDFYVEVARSDPHISWRAHSGYNATFFVSQYDNEIAKGAADTTWEDVGRQVERLVGAILADSVTSDGFAFQWASTRFIPSTVIKLSYQRGSLQRMFEFSWDGISENTATTRARQFLRELPDF